MAILNMFSKRSKSTVQQTSKAVPNADVDAKSLQNNRTVCLNPQEWDQLTKKTKLSSVLGVNMVVDSGSVKTSMSPQEWDQFRLKSKLSSVLGIKVTLVH